MKGASMQLRLLSLFFSIGMTHGVVLGAQQVPMSPVAECNRVRLWALPDYLKVEATPGDDRSFEELTTQARVNRIILAVARYCIAHDSTLPESYEDMLEFGDSLSASDRECTISGDLLDDVWGRPIFYMRNDAYVLISSSGGDGRFTTADDILNPSLRDAHTKEVEVGTYCGLSRRP